ncbi:DUF6787 family protein [Robertkochia solimangrovi]|uniref:DUF6787 family protein n=1 Tax=Robertkochia solimangrovi TaxID=2213046 RepID=UPI00117FA393|nr:DUF6787 family protein [Robertkochia solimangrovi]TRZ45326.1 diacylglyceryl transferase [Robertkochia solimangrovi]
MNKLKQRWGITSNFQFLVILFVFAITGSCAAKLGSPVTEFIGVDRETSSGWVYWPVRIFSIFPIYQVLLVVFGWLFGQFQFFWNFEKKMLSRMGIRL